ncbi:flavodoxin [Methylomonas sp. LL1]|uniref:flavodoxin n=1 Tax=Methylomonas sp. LL1 TaxID=2785785 RepID=UPI0018C3A1EA|nr:flavodoxin [Methylomonas sp. LL1]QPK64775.1 flavodoxin [Methylomonas sp. LL1]
MAKVGIFFGTDTGNSRKVAKTIHKQLGDLADKPFNVNKASIDDLLAYDVLIIGTPTYGEGELPGLTAGTSTESWEEFLPNLTGADLSGKTVALYGLGDQAGYPGNFVDALGMLYDAFADCGASFVGFTSTEGYDFTSSKAVMDDQFVGLVLDEDNQKELSDQRLQDWLKQIESSWA